MELFGQVLQVMISLYTIYLEDHMVDKKPLIRHRVIKLKLSSCLFVCAYIIAVSKIDGSIFVLPSNA